MAYRDDILAINESSLGAADGPSHYWTMDGNGTDLGSATTRTVTTNGGGSFTGVAFTQDSTNSLDTPVGGNGYATPGDVGLDGAFTTRSYSMWVQFDEVQTPTCLFFKGGGTNSIGVTAGIGRKIRVYAYTNSTAVITFRYATDPIDANTPYHLAWSISSGAGGRVLRFWFNGVEQEQSTDPDTVAFAAHTGNQGISFGNYNGVGGVTPIAIPLYGQTLTYGDSGKQMAHVAQWNEYLLTQGDVDILFENGANQVSQDLTINQSLTSTSIGLFDTDGLGGTVTGTTFTDVRFTGNAVIPFNVNGFKTERLRLVRYGFLTFSLDLRLARQDSNVNVALSTDGNITENNATTVRAYTQIDTLDQLYDYNRAYLEDNPTVSSDIISINGSDLDFGGFDIVFDGTAPQVYDVTGNTVTVRVATLFDSLVKKGVTTTGTITTQNGATLNIPRTDTAGAIGIVEFL